MTIKYTKFLILFLLFFFSSTKAQDILVSKNGKLITVNAVATPTAAGLVRLAGDLDGSFDAPTVPGLLLKAPLASPALTGTPTAPTASAGTNTTQIATTEFVTGAVATAAPDATTTATGKVQLAGELSGIATAPVLVNDAVINKVLTGYTSSAGTVAATDNIVTAIGKLNGNDALKAPLASPDLTGTPTAPTATAGTNTTQVATTAFVTGAVSTAAPNATTTATGKVQLAGDLAGTGTSATAPIITNGAVTSAKILDATIANIDLATGVGGIYKGNGSLAGNTTVSQGANNLTFTGTAKVNFENTAGITFPGNTRQGIAKVWDATTGDMFGIEQVSSAQAGFGALRLFTSNLFNAYMAFGKYTDATTFTEYARFSDATNFGIGVTAPTEKLHVGGNIRFSGALMPNNSAGTSGQVLTSAGAGVAPTWQNAAPAVTTVSNTSSANTISTTVNGVTGTAANIINTNTLTAASNAITSTVNGVPATLTPTAGGTIAENLGFNAAGNLVTQTLNAANTPNIYSADGTIAANRTVAQGTNNLAFTSTATTGTSHFTIDGTSFNVDAVNNRIGLGTATPSEKLSVDNGNIILNNSNSPLIRLHSTQNTNGFGGTIEFNETDNQYGARLRHNTAATASLAEGLYIESKSIGNYSPIAVFDQINNNVGFGITLPTERLDVNGNVKFSGALMPNNTAGSAGQVLTSSGAGSAPTWTNSTNIYSTDGTITGGNRTVAQGTNNLAFTSTATTGTSHFTVDGSTFNVDANTNRVGIGTNAPLGVLHSVAANINETPVFQRNTAINSGLVAKNSIFNLNTTTAPLASASNLSQYIGFSFKSNTESEKMVSYITARLDDYTTNTGSIEFNVGALNVSGGYIPPMKLASTGNLGLNVTAPTERLDVAGNVKFSGALLPNNTAGSAGQVLTSSGAGSAPTWTNSTNIYSTDGTITGGNRTVAQGTNNLAFTSTATTGTSHFTVDGSTFNVDANLNRVGIGDPFPESRLSITSPTSITNVATSNSTENVLRLTRPGTTGVKWNSVADLQIGSYEASQFSRSKLSFLLSDGSTNTPDVNVLTLQANQRVGIGTSSPTSTLSLFNDTASGSVFNAINADGRGFSILMPSNITSVAEPVTFNSTNSFDFALDGTSIVRLNDQGNVGIKNTAPSQLFQVTGGNILIGTSTTGTNAVLDSFNSLIIANDVGNANNSFRIDGFSDDLAIVAKSNPGSTTGTSISFRTAVAAGGEIERMRIEETGNVGIATTSPTSTLAVNGTLALSTATSGTAASVILSSTAVTLPTASTVPGRIYIIRNTSTTVSISIGSFVSFGSNTPGTANLSPSAGSITVISDGNVWWRIL